MKAILSFPINFNDKKVKVTFEGGPSLFTIVGPQEVIQEVGPRLSVICNDNEITISNYHSHSSFKTLHSCKSGIEYLFNENPKISGGVTYYPQNDPDIVF